MTIAYWCVLIALFLPYLSTVTAKAVGGGFSPRHNHDPRALLNSLSGVGRRAIYTPIAEFGRGATRPPTSKEIFN